MVFGIFNCIVKLLGIMIKLVLIILVMFKEIDVIRGFIELFKIIVN